MTNDNTISNAKLDWIANAPRSVVFDDIYFSGDGPAETEHVFLGGNDLPHRFASAGRMSIGELGFGAGLNFLCAWHLWRKSAPSDARLSYFSVEAFPLSPDDMVRAHGRWPALAGLSEKLRGADPPPHPGFHCIELESDVSLTLFFGDALDGLKQAEGHVDAWFLDGFSPAKNPDMWRPELMVEIARLSNPSATISTFTVAGAVRRGLAAAGFELERRAGFGVKREMLAGRLTGAPAQTPKRKPWFDTRETSRLAPGSTIAIIGAGIAGASLAHALQGAGMKPTVYEASALASGASGNPAGIIMPRLDAADTPAGRFHASAYLHAVRLLNKLNERADGEIFRACGVRQQSTDSDSAAKAEKLLRRRALPDGWIEQYEGGLYFPQAGAVDPPAFVKALLANVTVRNQEVVKLTCANRQWTIETDKGERQTHDAVVIANGFEALRFAQVRSLPLTGSAGQVDWFPDAPAPAHVLTFGAYVAPAPPFCDNGGGLVIGATYEKVEHGEAPEPSIDATKMNIDAIAAHAPEIVRGLDPGAAHPRISIRCVTLDRLPLAGPVPDWEFYTGAYDGLRHGRKIDYPAAQPMPGLYILTGLGSRGLVTAPLAAAMIALEMTAAPAPVDAGVAQALHPARFFIRDLKRARSGS